MIICVLKGGFGNHLLNYGIACVLSHKYDVKIKIISNAIKNDKLEQRNDTRTAINKILNYHYITKDNYQNNNTVNINTEKKYYESLKKINVKKNYKMSIIGTNLNFYTKHRDILKKYIKLNYDCKYKNPNSILISLRLGMGDNEVAGNSTPFKDVLRLPFCYYKNSIDYLLKKNNNIEKIIICSDNFTEKYLDNFYTEYNFLDIIKYNDKNTLEQFNFLINADYLISSNSTFSLLACVFNTNGLVITPDFKDHNNLNCNGENNLSIDSNNCIKIKINKPHDYFN